MGSTPIAGTIFMEMKEKYTRGALKHATSSSTINPFGSLDRRDVLPDDQTAKDRQIQEMRRALTVGDEIVTIGGICGKVVKTKDESFIIQVGADKVKFEMMRWAVSSVTKESARRDSTKNDVVEDDEPKKVMPKRLKKNSEAEEPAKAEPVKAEALEEAVKEAEEEAAKTE